MPEDNDRVHHVLVTWDPPLDRWCKPNCDGSWDKWETGGIGFILCNASCLMCRCRKLLRSHILYCKTAAVRGLLLARQLRIQRIQVETGPKVLVELYKDDTPIPWKTQSLLQYICYILTHSFLEFWVNHVLREGKSQLTGLLILPGLLVLIVFGSQNSLPISRFWFTVMQTGLAVIVWFSFLI